MESIYLYKAGKIEQSVSLMEIEQQALWNKEQNVSYWDGNGSATILSEARKTTALYIDSTLELVKQLLTGIINSN